jgi:hypothetical protein
MLWGTATCPETGQFQSLLLYVHCCNTRLGACRTLRHFLQHLMTRKHLDKSGHDADIRSVSAGHFLDFNSRIWIFQRT